MPSLRGQTESPYGSSIGRRIQEQQRRREFQEALGRSVSEISSPFTMEALERAREEMTRRIEPVTPDPWDEIWDPVENRPTPLSHFRCEGASSLIAEVERCYEILRHFPAPQDRTEQDIENLTIALTEEVATVTNTVGEIPVPF